MDFGIVIVSWNVRDLLSACLESVFLELAQSRLTGLVCVVDNDSRDGSADMVAARFPRVRLLRAENRGMGAGNNLGLRALGFGKPSAEGRAPEAALVLNPDTIVRPGALRALADFLRTNPRAGVAAPQLRNPDGSLQHAGFRFPGLTQLALDLFPFRGRLARLQDSPLNGRYWPAQYQAGSPFRVDHTLGAAFAVRAEAMAGDEFFDESFVMYCEEIDWQWRLALAGWETWIVPAAEVTHYGGRSTSQVALRAFTQLWSSRRRLYQRYHGYPVNALASALVALAVQRRIRENHRLSQRGQLSADERAERNQALAEVLQTWRPARRRP
jgi:N-acetylglucosaminyl-diphospho-decaprenol L-rhamnosyltransferase